MRTRLAIQHPPALLASSASGAFACSMLPLFQHAGTCSDLRSLIVSEIHNMNACVAYLDDVHIMNFPAKAQNFQREIHIMNASDNSQCREANPAPSGAAGDSAGQDEAKELGMKS